MKHIPNTLTSLRIVLTGIFAWQFFAAVSIATDPSNSVGFAAFWVPIAIYAIAFVTDILDGFLARTFGWITPLGKILDPIADKLMGVTALVCILIGKYLLAAYDPSFVVSATVYAVIFALVAVKELLMMLGGAYMLSRHKVAYSDWYGKTATGVFTAGVVLTLLSFAIPAIEPWNLVVLGIAAALGYIAAVHYARTQLRTEPKPPEQWTDDERRMFAKVDHILHKGN